MECARRIGLPAGQVFGVSVALTLGPRPAGDALASLVMKDDGIRPVRQVSIDDTWSALRFRPGSL